jgi:hypothetical protein
VEKLTDGTTRTRLIAVDQDGVEVLPPAPKVPVLPWGSIRHRTRLVVRPFYAAGGVIGIAALVDSAHIPATAVAAGGLVTAALAHRMAPLVLIRERSEPDERGRTRRLPARALTGKSAALLARRRRLCAYIVASAGAWVTAADLAGLDGHTVWSKLVWTTLAPLVAVAAKPWWNHVRVRPEPAGPADVAGVEEFGHLITARWATTVGAVGTPDRTVPPRVNGDEPTVAPGVIAGKLPGTVLEDVHRVAGGWAGTAVDPLHRGLEWVSAAVRRNVASVFGAGLAAVTLEPDTDDANRCLVMVQKQSPLRARVPWEGPSSFDPATGTGHFGRHADGTPVRYELYRPGWGSPHVALFGTTGSGKSEGFQQMFVIDRWAHHTGRDGVRRGLVADFLIDPQHGQSFGPFLDDLAAPVAATIEEAMMLVEAFTREGLRRNAHLANVEWFDGVGDRNGGRGRRRKGRKWWDPTVDGPILALNIDEAHAFLAYKVFAKLITDAARMWRKCGMVVRVGTHTPLLTDLGGSMALRDMLTGGFVAVYRTANALTGHTALNGQLPVDPRSIPKVPGMCYVLAGDNPRAMLTRTAWEEDYYDWVRDANEQPIGYPAQLPEDTLHAFGREFVQWRDGGPLVSSEIAKAAAELDPAAAQRAEDAVLEILHSADGPLDAGAISTRLEPHRQQGLRCALRTLREVLKSLADEGKVDRPAHGLYELSPAMREELTAMLAEELATAGQ